MGAIAFIISQYSLPPEERKFLVIKDENSKLIEFWVAAIESAFSPRMAAGLSLQRGLINLRMPISTLSISQDSTKPKSTYKVPIRNFVSEQ